MGFTPFTSFLITWTTQKEYWYPLSFHTNVLDNFYAYMSDLPNSYSNSRKDNLVVYFMLKLSLYIFIYIDIKYLYILLGNSTFPSQTGLLRNLFGAERHNTVFKRTTTNTQYRKDKEKNGHDSDNRCLLFFSYLIYKKFLLHFHPASQLKFFFKAFSRRAF